MKKIFAIISLIACLALFSLVSIFQFKQIKKSGVYDLDILKTNVNVHFDSFGVPHIEGESAEDVYRVLGFIMASDRLFQMDLMRRLVNGRLSEVFGDKTLEADILLRKLRFKKVAQDFWKNKQATLTPQLVSQLNAYLEGIHYFIDHQALPIEFDLLGYSPERFEVTDILGVAGYMSLTFAMGLSNDINLSELIERLPEDKINILRNGATSDQLYFPKNKAVKTDFLNRFNQSVEQIADYFPLFHGSNSWVLSGERTKSGKPILANDPHIGVSNPHIFYEAHIKHPNLEVYGEFLPLTPFPILGTTPYSSWAITMAMVDDVTVYNEKINPENKNQVMYKNEWVELEREVQTIKVKGKKDHFVEVLMTPHGPLIDNSKYGVDGKNLSLAWSVYHPENNTMQALFELPRARTVAQLRQAVSHAAAPGLNISWVNSSGDIAWWTLGKFPKLPAGVPSDVVLNGWDGLSEIESYYTIDENPHSINPASGVIVSANYQPQDI
ncbi:MAG: penicillin acylase family protein, partial [Halobacteriovoraceae bacterium]|nr:penicillin acylase family protein [Halobacteriovoraceae bacterium]